MGLFTVVSSPSQVSYLLYSIEQDLLSEGWLFSPGNHVLCPLDMVTTFDILRDYLMLYM